MDDLLSEFLTETSENLAVLDVELVKLERNPNDMELLGNIFRLVHTVKGTCGFLGLPRLEQVAHAGENILGKLRRKTAPPPPWSSRWAPTRACLRNILPAILATSPTGVRRPIRAGRS